MLILVLKLLQDRTYERRILVSDSKRKIYHMWIEDHFIYLLVLGFLVLEIVHIWRRGLRGQLESLIIWYSFWNLINRVNLLIGVSILFKLLYSWLWSEELINDDIVMFLGHVTLLKIIVKIHWVGICKIFVMNWCLMIFTSSLLTSVLLSFRRRSSLHQCGRWTHLNINRSMDTWISSLWMFWWFSITIKFSLNIVVLQNSMIHTLRYFLLSLSFAFCKIKCLESFLSIGNFIIWFMIHTRMMVWN